jgi:hypothetical protein
MRVLRCHDDVSQPTRTTRQASHWRDKSVVPIVANVMRVDMLSPRLTIVPTTQHEEARNLPV